MMPMILATRRDRSGFMVSMVVLAGEKTFGPCRPKASSSYRSHKNLNTGDLQYHTCLNS